MPVDHTMMDILDNVDPMLVIPWSIPSDPEGFTHPSKLSEIFYSLPDSVMESVTFKGLIVESTKINVTKA